ncbi:MAG: type II toxin-antitoxin system PemK/MazF family toxin [Candidatus Altiarchaeota archaeon]
MTSGTQYRAGDIVLAKIQFADTFEVKTRPAAVLFEEYGNIVVAGVTGNVSMDGIRLSADDGMAKDSVIKTNYIFTISEKMIERRIVRLKPEKRRELHEALLKSISPLIRTGSDL